MKKIMVFGLLAAMSMAAVAPSVAVAQLQKRVNFSISAPFAIRMGEYLLPPGQYVLFQVLQNDPSLFALHQGDMTNEPIALIRTTRIVYQSGQYPDDTMLLVDIDEANPNSHPMLEGWAIPGSDGWEVIGVVEKKKGFLTKLDDSSDYVKKDKKGKNKSGFTKYSENDRRSKIIFRKID